MIVHSMHGYKTQVNAMLIFPAALVRVDAYSKLVLGLLAFVYPFLLEAGWFKVSLFSTECACCIIGWALVAGMGISVTPGTGFLYS